MRYQNRESTQQEIDISPLIDMVFILLIFFMVSATFVKDMDIDIQRPKASSSTLSASKAIRVYVDRSGQIYIDDQIVRSWVVQSRVRGLLEQTDSKSVLVIIDENVAASKLIEVVDQCRLAGSSDVGVVTQAESGR